MAAELFFIYDTHCPWSYAATPLINAVNESLPKVNINLWHCAYFSDADGLVSHDKKQLQEIESRSSVEFSQSYANQLQQGVDSTLCANLMTWAAIKIPKQALPLLNAIQSAHFSQGNKLAIQNDLNDLITEFKLSPPAKVLNHARLSNDAEAQVHEVYALQEIINTQAIPAVLLAVDNELILLNHNLYLTSPNDFVDAVSIELNKYSA